MSAVNDPSPAGAIPAHSSRWASGSPCSLDGRINAFDDPAAARVAFIDRQPMGRLGTAEEIAALALYLASDEAGFTTGTIMLADGGFAL